MSDNDLNDENGLMISEGMDAAWDGIKDQDGVCDHPLDAFEPDAGHDWDRLMAVRKDYRWTPTCQRVFLEELAINGSVTRSAKMVNKSPRAAYALRFRRDGSTFHLGWSAAILIARYRIADMLIDRAVCGFEEFTQKEEDGTRRRGRFDNRLSANMLSRLDRIAEREALAGSRDAQVQLIVQDWEAYLDLVDKGVGGAEVATWLEASAPGDGDGDALKSEIDCELAQISAAEEEPKADMPPEWLAEEEPEKAVSRMHVWWDKKWERWLTNFPLADEDRHEEDRHCNDVKMAMVVEDYIEGDEWVIHIGSFGHSSYRRTLTAQEEGTHNARMTRELAPWVEAANAARDAWFAVKEAA